MKLSGAQATGFAKAPPLSVTAVLIHGPDEGAVRERADDITRTVLGGATDDPFRLTLLGADTLRQDPARLADEAMSQSLVGGRRVVRVRDAGDALSKTIETVLGSPAAALLVLESGDLGRSSSLRTLIERAPNAAAIACYADGPKEIAQLLKETLGSQRIRIDEDALAYLVEHLGNDRSVTRQEIEKLSLAVGDGGTVTLAEAVASIGDSSALELEDVIYDAFDGRSGAVDDGLNRLFQNGESAVAVLRAAQRHLQRLHLCVAAVAHGSMTAEVVRSLRPPIFFRFEPRFKRQIENWSVERLERLVGALTRAELECKSTGMPDETVCRHVLTMMRPTRPARGGK